MIKINIANEFSKLPGPRYIAEGQHSGELFRETILHPRFKEARSTGKKLIIELDGVRFGYPASFLEESFGGLARAESISAVLEGLTFISADEPLLVEEIKNYIQNADKTSRQRAEAR